MQWLANRFERVKYRGAAAVSWCAITPFPYKQEEGSYGIDKLMPVLDRYSCPSIHSAPIWVVSIGRHYLDLNTCVRDIAVIAVLAVLPSFIPLRSSSWLIRLLILLARLAGVLFGSFVVVWVSFHDGGEPVVAAMFVLITIACVILGQRLGRPTDEKRTNGAAA
jgi:hypothetical protein